MVKYNSFIKMAKSVGGPLLLLNCQKTSFLGFVNDITSYKRHEAVLAARLRLLQLVDTCSLEEWLRATVDEAEELTGSRIGFYHFFEADQQTISLQTWSTNTQNICTRGNTRIALLLGERGCLGGLYS